MSHTIDHINIAIAVGGFKAHRQWLEDTEKEKPKNPYLKYKNGDDMVASWEIGWEISAALKFEINAADAIEMFRRRKRKKQREANFDFKHKEILFTNPQTGKQHERRAYMKMLFEEQRMSINKIVEHWNNDIVPHNDVRETTYNAVYMVVNGD